MIEFSVAFSFNPSMFWTSLKPKKEWSCSFCFVVLFPCLIPWLLRSGIAFCNHNHILYLCHSLQVSFIVFQSKTAILADMLAPIFMQLQNWKSFHIRALHVFSHTCIYLFLHAYMFEYMTMHMSKWNLYAYLCRQVCTVWCVWLLICAACVCILRQMCVNIYIAIRSEFLQCSVFLICVYVQPVACIFATKWC